MAKPTPVKLARKETSPANRTKRNPISDESMSQKKEAELCEQIDAYLLQHREYQLENREETANSETSLSSGTRALLTELAAVDSHEDATVNSNDVSKQSETSDAKDDDQSPSTPVPTYSNNKLASTLSWLNEVVPSALITPKQPSVLTKESSWSPVDVPATEKSGRKRKPVKWDDAESSP